MKKCEKDATMACDTPGGRQETVRRSQDQFHQEVREGRDGRLIGGSASR